MQFKTKRRLIDFADQQPVGPDIPIVGDFAATENPTSQDADEGAEAVTLRFGNPADAQLPLFCRRTAREAIKPNRSSERPDQMDLVADRASGHEF